MKRILVIEDTFEIRDNLMEILELAGYEVEGASNGIEGIKSAKEFKPNLIICDVMMPQLDGFGVLKILRENEQLRSIPFLFLTAKSEKSDFRKGMQLGADDYIVKPFEDSDILEAVEARLKKFEQMKKKFAQSSFDTGNSFYSEAKAEQILAELKKGAELKTIEKNEYLFKEGEKANFLYYILEGKAKISTMNDWGKELITEVAEKDSYCGLYAIIEGSAYAVGAQALERTSILQINKSKFLELLYSKKEISIEFLKLISGKKAETDTKLLAFAYGSVRERVAKSLEDLISGKEEGEPKVIVSREDLAAMAGTAKETTIRMLSEFKKEGLIQIDGSIITVLDLSGLKAIYS